MTFGSIKKHFRSSEKSKALEAEQDSPDESVLPPPLYEEKPDAKQFQQYLESTDDSSAPPHAATAGAGSQNASSSSTITILPNHIPAAVRTLHIKHTSLTCKRATIYDPDHESTPLYRLHTKMTKPHFTFTSDADPVHNTEENPLATTCYHWTKSRIDNVLRGQDLTLTCPSRWKMVYSFESRILGNSTALVDLTTINNNTTGATANGPSAPQTFTWTMEKTWRMDLLCKDSQGRIVARFLWGKLFRKIFGSLELYLPETAAADNNGTGNNNPALEELTVTGMAYAYYVYQMLAGTNGAAAAGASGGAGA